MYLSDKPCKKHGPNPWRRPNGNCRDCTNEARERYKAKLGKAEWDRRRRLYDKATYDKPGSKTYIYRRSGRKFRRIKNPEGFLYANTRMRAQKAGLTFTLSRADCVMPERCPVFGTKLEYTIGKRTPNTPSVDRIDSTRGYEPGNCIVVSWRVNSIKMDATPDELLAVGKFYKAIESGKRPPARKRQRHIPAGRTLGVRERQLPLKI